MGVEGLVLETIRREGVSKNNFLGPLGFLYIYIYIFIRVIECLMPLKQSSIHFYV